MAGSYADYLKGKLQDHTFGNTSFSAPATLYFALFSVAPTSAGGGTEATGTAYARKAMTNNTTNFPNATGTSTKAKTNGTQIDFPTPGGNWSGGSNMVAWGIFDASTSGNLIAWGDLTTPKPALSGDPVYFPASSLVINLT